MKTQGSSILVTHNEVSQELNFAANTAFKMHDLCISEPGLDVNPTCTNLFPWLTGLASHYEKYRFRSLVFRLRSTNPSTVAGSVMMALDYDYTDEPSPDLSTLMSNSGCVSTSIWQDLTLRAEVARMNEDIPFRYTMDGPRSVGDDRWLFGGYLMVATVGLSSSASFLLETTYTVELSLPQLPRHLTGRLYSGPVDASSIDLGPTAGNLGAGSRRVLSILPSVLTDVTRGIRTVSLGNLTLARPTDIAAASVWPASGSRVIELPRPFRDFDISAMFQMALVGTTPKTLVDGTAAGSTHKSGFFLWDRTGSYKGMAVTSPIDVAMTPKLGGSWGVGTGDTAGQNAYFNWDTITSLLEPAARNALLNSAYLLPFFTIATGGVFDGLSDVAYNVGGMCMS